MCNVNVTFLQTIGKQMNLTSGQNNEKDNLNIARTRAIV